MAGEPSFKLLTEDWADQFAREANDGPDEERLADVEQNYWEWIDKRSAQINVILALALREEAGTDRYAYFCIEQGCITKTWCDAGERRGEAGLVLGASREDWAELLQGQRTLSQNIMYRRIRLFQGNLHYFFRNIYFFVELIRQGLRAPTSLIG